MIAAVAVILSGCSKPVGEVLGFEKNAPDEFAVVKRAPLTLPPDFGLRPPRPGAPRPQEVSSRDSAQEALIGTSSESDRPVRNDSRAARAQRTKGLSPAEVALLTKSGALDVDPSIRDVINKEAAGAADTADESFVDKLLFWRDKKSGDKASGDTVVDASKERRRLQENEALGKPVTAGKTPTIRRKEGSIFF
jgi:hypothetical protein